MAMLQSGSKDVDPKAVVDDVTGDTLLHVVAENNNVEGMRFLLDRKCNPNALNKKGVTPLFLAAKSGSKMIVESLVLAGADVNKHRTPGDTERGGAVELTDMARTPLQGAALEGHLDIIHYLLRKGANKGTAGGMGLTALHFACMRNHEAVVMALVEAGAGLLVADAIGRMPSDYAKPPLSDKLQELMSQAKSNFGSAAGGRVRVPSADDAEGVGNSFDVGEYSGDSFDSTSGDLDDQRIRRVQRAALRAGHGVDKFSGMSKEDEDEARRRQQQKNALNSTFVSDDGDGDADDDVGELSTGSGIAMSRPKPASPVKEEASGTKVPEIIKTVFGTEIANRIGSANWKLREEALMQADVLVSSDQLQKRSRSLTEDEIFEAGCTLLALAARDKVVQVFYATVPFVRCLFGGGTLTKLPADGIVDADRRAGGFDEAEASDSDSLDEFDLPIGGKKGSAAPSKSKAQAAPPRAMQALVLPALEAFLGVVLIRASELNERTAKEARGKTNMGSKDSAANSKAWRVHVAAIRCLSMLLLGKDPEDSAAPKKKSSRKTAGAQNVVARIIPRGYRCIVDVPAMKRRLGVTPRELANAVAPQLLQASVAARASAGNLLALIAPPLLEELSDLTPVSDATSSAMAHSLAASSQQKSKVHVSAPSSVPGLDLSPRESATSKQGSAGEGHLVTLVNSAPDTQSWSESEFINQVREAVERVLQVLVPDEENQKTAHKAAFEPMVAACIGSLGKQAKTPQRAKAKPAGGLPANIRVSPISMGAEEEKKTSSAAPGSTKKPKRAKDNVIEELLLEAEQFSGKRGELPYAEPVQDEDGVLPLTACFGSDVARCSASQDWRARRAALRHILHSLHNSVRDFEVAVKGGEPPGVGITASNERGGIETAGPLMHGIVAALRPMLAALEDKVVHVYMLGAALLYTVLRGCNAVLAHRSMRSVQRSAITAADVVGNWSPDVLYPHPFPPSERGLSIGRQVTFNDADNLPPAWVLPSDYSSELAAALLWAANLCALHLGDSKLKVKWASQEVLFAMASSGAVGPTLLAEVLLAAEEGKSLVLGDEETEKKARRSKASGAVVAGRLGMLGKLTEQHGFTSQHLKTDSEAAAAAAGAASVTNQKHGAAGAVPVERALTAASVALEDREKKARKAGVHLYFLASEADPAFGFGDVVVKAMAQLKPRMQDRLAERLEELTSRKLVAMGLQSPPGTRQRPVSTPPSSTAKRGRVPLAPPPKRDNRLTAAASASEDGTSPSQSSGRLPTPVAINFEADRDDSPGIAQKGPPSRLSGSSAARAGLRSRSGLPRGKAAAEAEEEKVQPLPYAEALSEETKKEMEPLIEVFGERLVACLLSKEWSARQIAVKEAGRQLKLASAAAAEGPIRLGTAAATAGGRGRLGTAIKGNKEAEAAIRAATKTGAKALLQRNPKVLMQASSLIERALCDSVAAVYLAGLQALTIMVTEYLPTVPGKEFLMRAALQPALRAAVARLSDTKGRIRTFTEEVLMKLSNSLVIPPQVITQVGVEMLEEAVEGGDAAPNSATPTAAPPAVLAGRLHLLWTLVTAHGFREDEEDGGCGIDVDRLAPLLHQLLEHRALEVRNEAIELYSGVSVGLSKAGVKSSALVDVLKRVRPAIKKAIVDAVALVGRAENDATNPDVLILDGNSDEGNMSMDAIPEADEEDAPAGTNAPSSRVVGPDATVIEVMAGMEISSKLASRDARDRVAGLWMLAECVADGDLRPPPQKGGGPGTGRYPAGSDVGGTAGSGQGEGKPGWEVCLRVLKTALCETSADSLEACCALALALTGQEAEIDSQNPESGQDLGLGVVGTTLPKAPAAASPGLHQRTPEGAETFALQGTSTSKRGMPAPVTSSFQPTTPVVSEDIIPYKTWDARLVLGSVLKAAMDHLSLPSPRARAAAADFICIFARAHPSTFNMVSKQILSSGTEPPKVPGLGSRKLSFKDSALRARGPAAPIATAEALQEGGAAAAGDSVGSRLGGRKPSGGVLVMSEADDLAASPTVELSPEMYAAVAPKVAESTRTLVAKLRILLELQDLEASGALLDDSPGKQVEASMSIGEVLVFAAQALHSSSFLVRKLATDVALKAAEAAHAHGDAGVQAIRAFVASADAQTRTRLQPILSALLAREPGEEAGGAMVAGVGMDRQPLTGRSMASTGSGPGLMPSMSGSAGQQQPQSRGRLAELGLGQGLGLNITVPGSRESNGYSGRDLVTPVATDSPMTSTPTTPGMPMYGRRSRRNLLEGISGSSGSPAVPLHPTFPSSSSSSGLSRTMELKPPKPSSSSFSTSMKLPRSGSASRRGPLGSAEFSAVPSSPIVSPSHSANQGLLGSSSASFSSKALQSPVSLERRGSRRWAPDLALSNSDGSDVQPEDEGYGVWEREQEAPVSTADFLRARRAQGSSSSASLKASGGFPSAATLEPSRRWSPLDTSQGSAAVFASTSGSQGGGTDFSSSFLASQSGSTPKFGRRAGSSRHLD